MTISRELAEFATGYGAGSFAVGRNRIINGAMEIDQRNAGASVTPTIDSTYTIDRWSTRNYSGSGRFSVEQVSASLASFEYAAKLTVTTTDTPGTYGYSFSHRIEGYNVSDLGFGTSDAQTVTLSFWVKSSIAGTYCVSLRNKTATDSYVAEYSISSANTWEKKTITITGPTSGTWLKTNDTGAIFEWSLGSQTSKQTTANAWQSGNYVTTSNQTAWIATNGATFYLTGVQLEAGSVATSFERRSYGQELALCQRYYYRIKGSDTAVNTGIVGVGFSQGTTVGRSLINFPVTMRSVPSALEQSGTASHYRIIAGSSGSITCSAVPTFSSASTLCGDISWTVASGATANQGVYFASNDASSYLAWSAEI